MNKKRTNESLSSDRKLNQYLNLMKCVIFIVILYRAREEINRFKSLKVSQLSDFVNKQAVTYNERTRDETLKSLKRTNKKSYYALLKQHFSMSNKKAKKLRLKNQYRSQLRFASKK